MWIDSYISGWTCKHSISHFLLKLRHFLIVTMYSSTVLKYNFEAFYLSISISDRFGYFQKEGIFYTDVS